MRKGADIVVYKSVSFQRKWQFLMVLLLKPNPNSLLLYNNRRPVASLVRTGGGPASADILSSCQVQEISTFFVPGCFVLGTRVPGSSSQGPCTDHPGPKTGHLSATGSGLSGYSKFNEQILGNFTETMETYLRRVRVPSS